jgi:hypothetical protein
VKKLISESFETNAVARIAPVSMETIQSRAESHGARRLKSEAKGTHSSLCRQKLFSLTVSFHGDSLLVLIPYEGVVPYCPCSEENTASFFRVEVIKERKC